MTSGPLSSLDSSAALATKSCLLLDSPKRDLWGSHQVQQSTVPPRVWPHKVTKWKGWLELWEYSKMIQMTFVERTKCQHCLQLQSSSRSPCGTRQFPAVSTSKCISKVEERNLLTNPSILETKILVIRTLCTFRLQHCFALHFTLCGSESELGREIGTLSNNVWNKKPCQ